MKSQSKLLLIGVASLFIGFNVYLNVTQYRVNENVEHSKSLIEKEPLSQAHWLKLAYHYQVNGDIDLAKKTLDTAASLSQNNITLLKQIWKKQLAFQDASGASTSAKRLLQIDPKNSYIYYKAMTVFYDAQHFIKQVLPKQNAANRKDTNYSYLTKLIEGVVTEKNGEVFKQFWRSMAIEDRDYIAKSPSIFFHYHNYLRGKDFDTIYDISITSENNYLFRNGEFTLPFSSADADNPFCWIVNQHPESQWHISNSSVTIDTKDNVARNRHNMTCFLPVLSLSPSLITIETTWSGANIDEASSALISIEPRFSKHSLKKAPVTRSQKFGTWSNDVIKQEITADIDFLGFNIFISPPQPTKMKVNSKNQISLNSFRIKKTHLN